MNHKATITIELPIALEQWLVKHLWRYLNKEYKQYDLSIHKEKHNHTIKIEDQLDSNKSM